jgi:hypothetical protein
LSRSSRLPLKVTGANLTADDEVTAFRWATPDDITGLAEEAYAVRILDARQ